MGALEGRLQLSDEVSDDVAAHRSVLAYGKNRIGGPHPRREVVGAPAFRTKMCVVPDCQRGRAGAIVAEIVLASLAGCESRPRHAAHERQHVRRLGGPGGGSAGRCACLRMQEKRSVWRDEALSSAFACQLAFFSRRMVIRSFGGCHGGRQWTATSSGPPRLGQESPSITLSGLRRPWWYSPLLEQAQSGDY